MIPSENCYKLIESFEGFREQAYQDGGGVWTYGIGFTVTPNGQRVQAGDSITYEDAMSALPKFVKSYADYVNIFFRGITITQQQFDALTDFTYNRGQGNAGRSALFAAIKLNPNSPSISASFSDHQNIIDHEGNVENGLIRRRKAEAWMYDTGEVKTEFPEIGAAKN